MAWRKSDKKKRKNRMGDVPGMLMLAIVLVYSVVMVVDGYLLCRSGLIGQPPSRVCPEKPQEIVYVSGEEGSIITEGRKNTYLHNALRLTFDYPAEWGPVTIREEMGTDPTGREIIAGLMLYFRDMSEQSGGGLFMHANFPNADLSSRRLDYWGTDAVRISSVYDLKEWCEGKGSCNLFTNSNGVDIVKQKINPGGTEGKSSFDVHYLYNPNGGYSGVALSSERLDPKFGAANLQNGFEELVDSIRVVE